MVLFYRYGFELIETFESIHRDYATCNLALEKRPELVETSVSICRAYVTYNLHIKDGSARGVLAVSPIH